ncbi:RNA polymerase sigma-70 factor [Tellurirhabdus bombi]|uniref:RNA polymerase sigma-70 factor n=1 Tax=Tellurirhabdus bombi TaxID=2907205 RepID=UPI001F2B5A59|nr:RNA polymerase sigma-70 factor [Tellurirhabdus bombi]
MSSDLYPDRQADESYLFKRNYQASSETEPVEIDREFFIRQAFERDARQACELLFRLYYAPLCSHAVRFVHNRQVAEDLVADVFYSLLAQELYRHITTSFRAYLFRAVRNRAYNYIRWELGRQEAIPDGVDRPDTDTAQPDRLMQQDELQLAVEEAVRQLSPQQQRVFVLSRFEGKKYKEIADELSLTPKTVENHLLRALAALRNMLVQKHILLLGAITTWFSE